MRGWWLGAVGVVLGSSVLLAACGGVGTGTGRMVASTRMKARDGASFSGQVAPLVSNRCMGCHMQGRPGGRVLQLFDGSGAVQHGVVADSYDRIVRAVERGSMPPRGPKFTQEEVAVLKAWKAAGLPNN